MEGPPSLRGTGPFTDRLAAACCLRSLHKWSCDWLAVCRSDGFAYGDQLPDYFLLACHTASDSGGENYLVDGLKVLELIDSDPVTSWAADALRSRKIDQTEAVSAEPRCMPFFDVGFRRLKRVVAYLYLHLYLYRRASGRPSARSFRRRHQGAS